MITEEELVLSAKRYLKYRYLETTISMDVLENKVVKENGQLTVDCTVKFLGLFKSDWTKTFTFKNGKVVSMQATKR